MYIVGWLLVKYFNRIPSAAPAPAAARLFSLWESFYYVHLKCIIYHKQCSWRHFDSQERVCVSDRTKQNRKKYKRRILSVLMFWLCLVTKRHKIKFTKWMPMPIDVSNEFHANAANSRRKNAPTFPAKRAPHCYKPNEKSECHCLCFRARAHTHSSLFFHVILMWTFVCRRFFFFVIESKLLDQKPHLFGLVVVVALAPVMFVIASNKKILFTIAIIISRTSYIFDEHIPWLRDPNFRLCVC